MASPAAQVDMLHASSLDFALTNIPSLPSTQLALCLFHPEATKDHVDCARIEFMRRREDHLRAQLDRMMRESADNAAAPPVCAPISPDVEPRDESLTPADPKSAAVKVKREVEEITLVDSDDDTVMRAPPLPHPKQRQQQLARKSAAAAAAQPGKRASSIAAPESADIEVLSSKRQRVSTSASAVAKSASPPRQETLIQRDQLKQLSFRRKVAPSPSEPPQKAVAAPVKDDAYMPFALPTSTAQNPVVTARAPAAPSTPPPASVGSTSVPRAPSKVALASPVAQVTVPTTKQQHPTTLEASVDPRKRIGAPLAPAARPTTGSQQAATTAAPHRVPAATSIGLNLDVLYRPNGALATTENGRPVLPMPVFEANPITAAAHEGHEPKFSFTAQAPPADHEPDREFWFHPPRPFPTFSPLPPTFPHAANDVIPVKLAGQLHTVRVRGLDCVVTRRLLLAFLTRNSHRLRPRVLAFRARDFEIEGVPQSVFYLAFRSEQDALLTIEGNNKRRLPHIDNTSRTLVMTLVRAKTDCESLADFLSSGDEEVDPIESAADPGKKGEEGEVALGWTWGELSDELRDEWLASERLPHYRVCPRYEFEADIDNHVLINDEYEDEVTHILKLENRKDRLRRKASRPHIEKKKLKLYNERCHSWLSWLKRSEAERAQALENGEIEWPLWPDDAAVETD
ncbi:hypothetical protein JCM10908_001009 [Rhodotorula pacifica]|uniref:uncharacterized protein n=1 Tax=Rhodotorula pacifica TaxID=1495444 RepID=UPI00316DC30D